MENSERQSGTEMKRVHCRRRCALLSLSSIVESNKRALQQGAEIGQRGWTGDVDAIVS